MATKNTTKQVAGEDWKMVPWHVILKNRAHDLAMDKDHTLTYADRDRVSPTTSRNEIVQMYETAYSELAESFHGHLERIGELDAEVGNLERTLSQQREHIFKVEERLDTAMRRLSGLLLLIEQPIEQPLSRQWFPEPTDQYQAMKPV